MSDPRRPGPPPLQPYPSFEERAYGHGQQPPQPTLSAPPRGPNGPQRRRRKKKSRWGTILFLVVLGVIAVVSAIGVFLVSNPPTGLIRAQLIDQVKARTGRTLTIAGPTKFTIFPSLGLSMKDVTLSPPPGMTGPDFAKMAGLDVSVRLLPLLKREVSINQLVLQQPVINLRVDNAGNKSWDFVSATSDARPVRLAQAPGGASDAPGGLPSDAQDFLQNARDSSKRPNSKTLAELRQLQLGDVRIVNGIVRYDDAQTNTKHYLSAVNMRLGLEDINAPLDAKGSVQWRKEKIDLVATVTSVDDILRTRPAALVLKLSSKPLNARYDGTVHLGDVVAAKGAVAADSPSLRRLAEWMQSPLPPARGYGPLQFSGVLDSKGDIHKLASAKVDLDNQLAKGTVTVKTGGARPYVNAKLTVSQLDINAYLSDGGPAPASSAQPAPSAPANSKSGSKPQSIEDLLGASGPQVKGYTQRSGWSRDPINVAGLGAADVDADLTIGKIFVRNLKIGRSDIEVRLNNKKLKTTIKDIQLYEGRGNGVITANALSNKTVGVGANLTLSNVEARNLLRDAVNQDWLAGKGTLQLAVNGTGATQNQIMNTLAGNASMNFKDGAVIGLNVAKLIRGVSQGNLTNLSAAPDEKTDFSSLSATWGIEKGVARNSDLQLLSPLLRVAGQGDVSLGAQQVDYLVRPTLVANIEGQGADGSSGGLEVPVRVKGPWAKPSIQPELGDILANPDKAIDAVKKLGQQFKGKDAGEILDGLLGGGNSGGTSGEKKPNAGDLLDRFLR